MRISLKINQGQKGRKMWSILIIRNMYSILGIKKKKEEECRRFSGEWALG
jgi:hypothetical protein